MSKLITLEQLYELAEEFNYNPRTVQAVMEVEAPRGGFLSDGRVVILFERHVFYRLSKMPDRIKFLNPKICNRSPGGYAKGQTADERGIKEWGRLEAAMLLDRTNALKSASWGRGQIMGQNHEQAGYHTVNLMVEDFATGEAAQVWGMLNFIKSNRALDMVMKDAYPGMGDFIVFAKGYNGPNYEKNKYHLQLEHAYANLKNG